MLRWWDTWTQRHSRKQARLAKWRAFSHQKGVFGRKVKRDRATYYNCGDIYLDCDSDTLLVGVNPIGQHATLVLQRAGTETNNKSLRWCGFISLSSYWLPARDKTLSLLILPALYTRGTKRISPKVGEEGVEVALRRRRTIRQVVLQESADLIYHLMVLYKTKAYRWTTWWTN